MLNNRDLETIKVRSWGGPTFTLCVSGVYVRRTEKKIVLILETRLAAKWGELSRKLKDGA